MRLSEERLTPAGAQLLRQARDQIVAHPEQFDKGVWDCGTRACIAGWVCRLAGIALPEVREANVTPTLAAEALGLSWPADYLAPVCDLFLEDAHGNKRYDIAATVADINAFLWKYGYPPDEISDGGSERQLADAPATTTNAVAEAIAPPVLATRA